MKLMILGAGRNQLGLIKRAREMGHEVITCDYLPDAPGRKLADRALLISTMDRERILAAATQYKADGIATVGTDQPVAVAAWVAEKMGLPCAISYNIARSCTNKVLMKEIYKEANIAAPRSVLLERDWQGDLEQYLARAGGLPVVIKPQDSQGQRGVYLVRELNTQVYEWIEDAFQYTHQPALLAEEYIEGKEITISAWVKKGKVYPLLITDRPLLEVEPHLGLPTAHVFPAMILKERRVEVEGFAQQVVDGFGIKEGPVYLQVIVANDGRLVMNEVACRVGGGHEDRLIPLLTGFDILEALIRQSLGQEVELPGRMIPEQKKLSYAVIKFIFARPGKVERLEGWDRARQVIGVREVVPYNLHIKEVLPLTDSTRRIGYMMVTAPERDELIKRVKEAYACLKVISPSGHNMTIYPELTV